MLSEIFKRLRPRKSRPRVVLVPPDLSLRDSFASPFPHVGEGGYRLYYELELLQRKRAEKEKQNTTISASKTLRGHAPSCSQTQTPGASSSRNQLPPLSMPQHQDHQNVRRHDTTKPTRSRRQGLEKIPEASSGRPHRSVRKRKKIKNLRQVMETQAVKQDRTVMDQMDTPGTALSHLASSSCGHGTVDTPPTTVEDLAEDEIGVVVNFKRNYERSDNKYVDASPNHPFDRPESVSSYYTARSHFSVS